MNPYFKEGNDPFPLTYPIKDKSQYGYPVRERFTAIDPAGDETLLRFKPIHKNEIETIYCSFDTGLNMYLKLDQPAEIFLHRALAYCKTGEVTNANKDIQQYIRSLESHEISKLVSGGFLFSKEGYNTEAHTLFSAALEQCLLSESKRIEKRNAAASDQERAFYDEGLARDAELKSRIYTGLNALK